jgi:3-mercaptopyruvate sulfurtransferase SseA
MEKGFTRVRPLAGGFDAWLEAGFAVEDAETVLAVRRPDAAAG